MQSNNYDLCYQSEIFTELESRDFVPVKNGRKKKKILKKEGDEGSIGFELPFSLVRFSTSFHSSLGAKSNLRCDNSNKSYLSI